MKKKIPAKVVFKCLATRLCNSSLYSRDIAACYVEGLILLGTVFPPTEPYISTVMEGMAEGTTECTGHHSINKPRNVIKAAESPKQLVSQENTQIGSMTGK